MNIHFNNRVNKINRKKTPACTKAITPIQNAIYIHSVRLKFPVVCSIEKILRTKTPTSIDVTYAITLFFKKKKADNGIRTRSSNIKIDPQNYTSQLFE